MNERGWYWGTPCPFPVRPGIDRAAGRDLNVVFRCARGRLFTTEEFTGSPVATADGRHVTWVSQENRQPFFGHLVLWGCSDR
jgi:hypothetical protein